MTPRSRFRMLTSTGSFPAWIWGQPSRAYLVHPIRSRRRLVGSS
jgi:hypothetical protein